MIVNRFQPILIAGLLPLLIFGWFVRPYVGQMDFWLLWLLAMTLVSLPLLFAEVALAHRSGTAPLIGLPKLTREGDIANHWRGFGWLTLGLLAMVGGHLLASAATMLHPSVTNIATPALLAILLLGVIGLSFTKQLSGWLALGLGLIALLLTVSQTGLAAWQMTDTSLGEWASAVILALVCVGVGTGLYWQLRANQLVNDTHDKIATSRLVLPIWGFQLLGGALIAMTAKPATELAAIVYALAWLAGCAYLLQMITQQLSLRLFQRGSHFLVVVIVGLVMFGLALLPTDWLNYGLVILSLITALWLALFAGWQMKISHMRKSLNFGSEAIYNLWRVMVRIVTPLAIALALVGWGMRGLGQV